MIESTSRFPGVPSDIPEFIREPACTCGRCAAGLSCSYKQSIYDTFPLRTDADFERPHQHTIVEDYVREWQPIIAGFDTATVDRLINVIESIKLKRAIERRTELETLLTRTRGDLASLSNEWEKVQGGIVQMVSRGVQR